MAKTKTLKTGRTSFGKKKKGVHTKKVNKRTPKTSKYAAQGR
jgi:hypothetical protein